MDAEPARLIIEALKEEKIDLFVTLPEEPTASLTQAVQADPYFQCVTVASEDGGVALTAGAAIATKLVGAETGRESFQSTRHRGICRRRTGY